ncbi:MAG: EAL domain-containing protein [Acidimicrobiales bacterium]
MNFAPFRIPRGFYRLGVIASIVALVPAVGAGWLVVREVDRAQTQASAIAEVDQAVRQAVDLARLRTRLLEERNWVTTQLAVVDLGLDVGSIEDLVGIDIAGAADAATAAVDGLIGEVTIEGLADQLVDLRAEIAGGTPFDEASGRYQELEALAAEQTDGVFDLTIGLASSADAGRGLIDSVRALEAATAARQATASQINHYFGSMFLDPSGRAGEIAAVAALEQVWQEAIDTVARVAPEGTSTASALAALTASPALADFRRDVNGLVTASILGAADDDALAAALLDLDAIAATYQSSIVATDLHLALVASAGADAIAASESAQNAAADVVDRSILELAGITVVGLLVALVVAQVVARPIRRLATAARRISEGDGEAEPMAEKGPVEVREAIRAINQASGQLALAERQALALADGDLTHPSLAERAPGALGASLQTAVETLAVSLREREEFRLQMTHEATHDGLTRLPNRNASIHQLEKALARTSRSDTLVAAFFIDLDGFKQINDVHGHLAGDVVLREAAQRLQQAARSGDHVGRLGGDEFLVVAEPVRDAAEARAIASRLIQAVAKPTNVIGSEVTIGVSIGIALRTIDTLDAEDLLRDADAAVYRAKALGRGRIELCDEDLRQATAHRADLEQALRTAIIDDDLVLHYQPIVDPETGAMVALEALVRWEREGHGTVPPDDFIPLAERSDLIVAVDQWVVARVARQIVAWDAADAFVDVPVAINISGRHLANSEVVHNVLGPLDEFGIDPTRIIIEVTESALLEDLGSAAHKLQQLRARGVRTAIDDFGTGYTSLAQLKTLPIDFLKIDRSFTIDESSHSLSKLIVDTGHLLGATVTAEGIETAEQAARLRGLGADELQGYLYGRPVPPDLLETGNAARRTDLDHSPRKA